MDDPLRISDELAVGNAVPSRDELVTLAREGFQSVIDLREPTETRALAPREQAALVRRFGLEYRNIPVPTDFLDEALLHRFRRAVVELPKPVLVHCGSGKRAGMFALMHAAIEEGSSGARMLARAERLGVSYGSAESRDVFRHYIDAHTVADRYAMTPREAGFPDLPVRRTPPIARRVPPRAAHQAGRDMADTLERRVAYYAAHPAEIDARLAALEREWELERVLVAKAATLSIGGALLGIFADRRFFVVPAAVGALLLQHAVQGWCPPVSLLRRLGFRSAREIDAERHALKALRGDFDRVPYQYDPAARGRAAFDAVWA
jgi:protein tyrosine phosphatase (PTP) superfamily phosphohydrolase (DUF442 family)